MASEKNGDARSPSILENLSLLTRDDFNSPGVQQGLKALFNDPSTSPEVKEVILAELPRN